MTAAQCRSCGTPISGGVYARDAQGYCCERCYLRAHEPRALRAESGQDVTEFAEALAAALDLREHETGQHSRRVACHTLVLARRSIDDPEKLRQIYWGALLHDIGKIGIPDAVLLKPGPLTGAEWKVMRTHPANGHAILQGLVQIREASEIVLCHEERYDGSGYPRGLAGGAIPFGARLFAVIDTLDAMTSDRPYRRGVPFEQARMEIERLSGRQFDPEAVAAFEAEEAALRDMVALKCGAATPPALGIV